MGILKDIVVLSFCLQLLSFVPMMSMAADADPLHDFCVADASSNITVNGLVCRSYKQINATDFTFQGLDKAGNTSTSAKSAVTKVSVSEFPGLNTLGISMARIDFARNGIIVPHTHPRATELLLVLKGSLYVGFVSTINELYATYVYKGDVFVFPKGLIHFQLNVGNGSALAISAYNSQDPGSQGVARSLFGAYPPISDTVLEKTFGLSQTTVDEIKADFKISPP